MALDTKRKGWDDTSTKREARNEACDAFADELSTTAVDLARRREPISTRWYHDLEQYQGVYNEQVQKQFKKRRQSSKLFVNLTRPKVRTLVARLHDILFPTDELNWDAEPTAVAELEMVAEHPGETGDEDLEGRANAVRNEAIKRAKLAKKEMSDQLGSSRYVDIGRKVIYQGCKFGLGVAKGPMHDWRKRRRWEDGELVEDEEERPYFEWVDCWNFFPDMDATSIESCDYIFELHRMGARELAKLAKSQGFLADNIRDVLNQGPMYESFTDYVNDMRDVESNIIKSTETRYFVWEYHGPIPGKTLASLCKAHDREDIMAVYGDAGDPLEVTHGIVWFCQGRIIRFGPHPLDSGDHLYSIWRLDDDESSVFGDGVPTMLRDNQRAINAAWRLMLDNAALAGVPMFVMDRSITPVEGGREIASGKLWEREHAQEAAGIQPVSITGNTNELSRIIEMAMTFMDQESNLPLVAQGEQSGHQTKTAHGLALLANAVNVIFRNAARSFDRDFTEPNIRRLYDWNLQYSKKQEIKGDVEIKARGSSVLLVRDIQAQNLMMIINLATTNPLLTRLLKIPAIARRLFQSLQLSEDEMVLTEAELRRMEETESQEGDPETDAKFALEELKLNGQFAIAEMTLKTEVLKLAAQREVSLEKIMADLEKVRMQTGSKERMGAAEFAIKKQFGTGI